MSKQISLAEIITKGIRPDSRFQRGFLRELTNLRSGPWGAKDFFVLNQPISDIDLEALEPDNARYPCHETNGDINKMQIGKAK
jgi:hypothetical protein